MSASFDTLYPAPDFEHWPRCARLSAHAKAALAQLPDDATLDGASHLANEVGAYRYHRAEYAAAEPLMRQALAIFERSFGPEHPEVAIRLNNLAGLLRDTNRLGEAEPLYRRALAIHERSFGPEHPNIAIRLNNLASLLADTKRLGEAEPLMRRALAIFEKSLPAGHPHVEACRRGLTQMQTSATEARRVRNAARSHAEGRRAAGEHPSAAHVQSNRNRTPNYTLFWIIALITAAALASAAVIRLQ